VNYSRKKSDKIIKVEKVEAFVTPTPPHTTVIVCYLENGKQFVLYYVPIEIVMAINKLFESEYNVENYRENVYEILPKLPLVVDNLSKYIDKIVIDEYFKESNVYSATIDLKFDGVIIQRRMIPSHAIYLALIARRPVYVSEELVEAQENQTGEGENG
jgi:bifunctional DNase/RNase